MPNRTITKFSAFVIFWAFVVMASGGCSWFSPNGSAQTAADSKQSPFEGPRITGKLESDDINESSGLAASKCQNDVFWTHNDSGDDAFIFAINSKGDHLGTWRVTRAANIDWEDIALIKDKGGRCEIYIGEIGNNARERGTGAVYRVVEPLVSAADKSSDRKNPRETEPAESFKFAYADVRRNAETMMVQPVSGDIYIVTKEASGPAGIYKLRPAFGASEIVKAEKIGELRVSAVPDGLLTGGDISSDGRHVVICDYFAGYELTLPQNAANFDEIWKQKPVKFDIGKREAGEAIAYTPDGNGVFVTSEKKHSPVIEIERRKTD